MKAEIDLLRTAQFTCNVTQFMQPPTSPVNMISIAVLPGSDPQNGFFKVDVTLRHPFPGLPIYRGFDVRGILIGNGTIASEFDNSAVYAGDEDVQLLNADGLTRWWNPTEFTSLNTIFGFTPGKLAPPNSPTATLNAYKYFGDAIGHDGDVWSMDTVTRGTFPTNPGIYTRPYDIQFPMVGGKVDFAFNYAVDASWDSPDPAGAPDYDIESFPTSANMAEPYCISVVDNGSTAYYEGPGSFGGKLKLALRIYDWQAENSPEGVPGEITGIWLESPVLNSPLDVLPGATVLPDGPTSSVFEVEIEDLNLTESGDLPLLVLAQASDDFGYEPQVPGGENFYFPSSPLGSYLLATLNVKSENQQTDAPIVTAIIPNSAQSGDILADVEVDGQFFATGAQMELRMSGQTAIQASSEVMQASGTKIICNLDLTLAAEGDWDVVVINPDLQEGVLAAGFHVDCAEGLHTYEGKHTLNGDTWNYCQRGDLTILETGPYAGECVVKSHYGTGGNYSGYYVRFDPDNASDQNATPFFNVKGFESGTPIYVTMTASIDQNPANGQIAVINGRLFNVVQIVDENGTYLEDVIITDSQTVPGQVPVIGGVDFDADGDMWLITNVKGIVDETYPPIWQLRHYELQSSSPWYVENMSDRLDISADLTDPNAQPYGLMWYIADIAISYTEDSLFALSASIAGWNHSYFVKWDLSTSPPTKVTSVDLVSSMVYCTNPYGISRADIEFDHSDASVENCRLMVMYQTWDGSVRVHLMRLDTDMNILNDQVVGPAFGAWDNPHAIAINTDAGNRNLIGIDMEMSSPWNDFYYFDMPSSGW